MIQRKSNSSDIYVYNAISKWNGNFFQMTSSTTDTILHGQISYSGNKIDSGYIEWNYYWTNNYRLNFTGGHRKITLNYMSLPLIKRTADRMIFSFSGSGLPSFISQFEDVTNAYDNLINYDYGLQKVLWNEPPTPTLIVEFYK